MPGQAHEGLLSPLLLRARLRAVRPFLLGRVLDFGSGTGALAAYCTSERYCGIEPDGASRALATEAHPGFVFLPALPTDAGLFETIVAMAVLEHLEDPRALLSTLAQKLAPGGTIVITTPAPGVAPLYRLGARLGLFSAQASAEHKALLGRASLTELARLAGLVPVSYARFLLRGNQLLLLRTGGAPAARQSSTVHGIG